MSESLSVSDRFDPASVRFQESTGLAPAIVQDAGSGDVLMLGYMNAESLSRTLKTRRVTFWSRSRQCLWEKGETSGNRLRLESIAADCDGDALLVRAWPSGATCHTGTRSCFDLPETKELKLTSLSRTLIDLGAVIGERDRERPGGSYTTHLLESGVLRCAQKVAEEGVEVALAAAADPERVASESADLLYHLLVLWRAAGVHPDRIAQELEERRSPAEAESGRSDRG
jgi:phosphoribosyl-ATP pyrophosphohydrolase/phosphoribosyl-AMP cyclohydrolase